MKSLVYCSLLVVLTVLSMSTTSEAFSRRSHQSEVAPSQTFTSTNTSRNLTEGGNVSAQAVPEPPVLFLMSLGLGAVALCTAFIGYRRRS